MTNHTEAIQKVTPEIFAFNHSTGASAEGFSREQVKPLVEALRERGHAFGCRSRRKCHIEEDCNCGHTVLLAQWSDV